MVDGQGEEGWKNGRMGMTGAVCLAAILEQRMAITYTASPLQLIALVSLAPKAKTTSSNWSNSLANMGGRQKRALRQS